MCVISTPSSWEIRIPCWPAHIYQMGGEATMEHVCLMRTSNHIVREWSDMIGLSNHFLSIAFRFHAPILRRWLDPQRGCYNRQNGWASCNHQEFQVPKMEDSERTFRLFWGVGLNIPYISRNTYSFYRWGFLHFRYLKCLVTQLCLSCFFHLFSFFGAWDLLGFFGGTKKPFITSWVATCPQVFDHLTKSGKWPQCAKETPCVSGYFF